MEKPVYLYDYVKLPFRVVMRILRDDPEALFEESAEQSVDRWGELVETIGVDVGGRSVMRSVKVDLGEFGQIAEPIAYCWRDVKWEAARAATLYPRMEGSIEAQPITSTESQLTFVGRYHPPLGFVGAAFDTLVLHRFAQASLLRFFTQLVTRLEGLHSAKAARSLPTSAAG